MQPSDFYKNLPTLTTPRLVLRKLRADDAPAYFAFASDPETTQYLRWGPHASVQATEAYLAEVLAGYELGQDGPWGIELAQEKRLIGTIHLMMLEYDPEHWSAEVGLVIARECWRQGIGEEVVKRVLAFCFEDLTLNRVQALPIADNTAACRLMETCGMQREGTLREYAFQKGRFWDFAVYSILRRAFNGT